MSVGFVRPNSSRLMLHVYERSVHPELFRTFAQTEISQEAWSGTLRICDTGHTVEFRYKGRTVTELTASRDQLLPQKKRSLEKSLRGCRDEAVRFDGGLRYSLSYQMERLEPNVFLNFHQELLGDCKHAAVAYRFPVENRLSPEPLSLLRIESAARSLLIHAFHTFPGSGSVLKTQSLFEL